PRPVVAPGVSPQTLENGGTERCPTRCGGGSGGASPAGRKGEVAPPTDRVSIPWKAGNCRHRWPGRFSNPPRVGPSPGPSPPRPLGAGAAGVSAGGSGLGDAGRNPACVAVDENARESIVHVGPVFGAMSGIQHGDGLQLSILGNTNSHLVTADLSGTDLTLTF